MKNPAEKLLVGGRLTTCVESKSYPDDEPQRRCPNISKAKKDLNYKTRVNLENGLKIFLEWAKTNYKVF